MNIKRKDREITDKKEIQEIKIKIKTKNQNKVKPLQRKL